MILSLKSKKKMPKITVDGQEYDDSSLSDECKGVINSLQFTKSELQKLEGMKAVLRTAEAAYSTLLKEKLPK